MNRIGPKRPALRLDLNRYLQLRQQVLERDNWRCQVCGSRRNLQIHHKQLRSQQGSDDECNLITLCASCHKALHERLGKKQPNILINRM
jgi:5-methylcytosine-specific restriction endonuclease McrA